MKTINLLTACILSFSSLSAEPNPEVIGGVLSADDKQLIRQHRESKVTDRLEIFAIVGAGGLETVKIPLFEVRKLKDNLNKDITFENPDQQILILARISPNAQNIPTFDYTLYSGTRYLEFKGKTEAAKRQSRFLSALTGAKLLLLKGTPTILYHHEQTTTYTPFDPAKPVTTDRSKFIVIALRE